MIASLCSSHSGYMKPNSRRWVAASLMCVSCFTDVGVGTRDGDGSGGEGADGSPTGGTGGTSQGGSGNRPGDAHGGTVTEGTGNVANTGHAGTRTSGAGTTSSSGALGGTAGTFVGSAGSTSGAGGTSGGISGGAGTSALGGTGNAGGTGGMSVTTLCGTSLEATQASNYSVSSVLSLDVSGVRPTADLTVDWSALTRDFRGRPVEGIDMVEVALWPLDVATFEQQLSDDTLQNPIIIAYILPETGSTSANLLDLQVPDGPLGAEILAPYFSVENYPPSNHTYSVMLANGTDVGRGTRMLKAFRLDPGSDTTDILIDSTSTQIAARADLHTLEPHHAPVSTPSIVIDWTGLRVTGAGGDFIPSSITRVDVAKFSASVPELEAGFFDLEELADERYTASVEVGTKYDLALTRDADQFFPGIDASGTWLLALSCGACQNPAPWYLTVLEPCAP